MPTQQRLFPTDAAATRRPTAYEIPIYRVTLVRESGCPTDQSPPKHEKSSHAAVGQTPAPQTSTHRDHQ